MRIPRWGVCLLGLGCCHFAGCSQTGWLRSNVPPDYKTVATVNGKPVSTISGDAGTGTARREDARDIDSPAPSGSRIAGRVYDEEGRGVPNARVRLGVGGSAGGRVNFATTDKSGAFTLHGLRPGVTYTLIAEYQGDDGMMSGRAQAKAPGSGVRIGLGARDPEPEAEPKSASLLPARVRSALFPEGETDGFPATAHPRANSASEGQDAPAEEATPSASRPTTARLASGTAATTTRAGWSDRQRPSSGPATRSRAATDGGETAEGPPTPGAVEDDGENPLPPALEPRDSTSARSARRDPRLYAAAPRPIPDDALPASGEIAPASYSRGGSEPADGDGDIPPRKTSNVRRGSRAAATAPRRTRDVGASQDPADPDVPAEDSSARPRPSRRPTWRDLSISPDNVPVDEALRRSSGEDDGDDRGAVVLADGRSNRDDVEEPQDREVPQKAKAKPRRARPAVGSPTVAQAKRSTAAAAGPLEEVCRMDPGHRRVLELRLPGLDGKMVSLSDIDADIIVLDFWGSWCIQCRKSIEHHRGLQQEFGDRKVQVIGIACEKGSTFEGRRDTAAAAAKQLGINYPVLVTTMEGACPVQGALRVQFYPTMVVLDREGNILEFEQGATDATLGRVDRVIAKAVDRSVDSRR